jgi:hypothetical protein
MDPIRRCKYRVRRGARGIEDFCDSYSEESHPAHDLL